MNDFCSHKGIKREFSNARTPQQNGVAERRNRKLIEAVRTMLADAKLPVTFWAKAVKTACYVQNRVIVNKSQNKTPYELFNGRTPTIGFLKPFGCHVMILNTLDNLGEFEAKGDEGYFIGYSMSSKAFRVFNKRTKRVEENLHVEFLENKAIEKGVGPNWLFDIDSLTKSMNYVSVDTEGTKILATVDGILKTVTESSLRRNLKLQDEEGISSLPDAEVFENLTLMGYNISPNQKFTFQNGRIVPLFDTMLVPQGEGSGTPTEPHQTPSPEAQQTSSTTPSSPTLPSVTVSLEKSNKNVNALHPTS
nr:retrovirus-related Pol polyprotein from transposon TNT 1-94 [Tanacetum cinerariifolium]